MIFRNIRASSLASLLPISFQSELIQSWLIWTGTELRIFLPC